MSYFKEMYTDVADGDWRCAFGVSITISLNLDTINIYKDNY